MAKPKTILVVEDEIAVRVLLRRLLEGAGFEVLEAADGVEALEAAEACPTGIDLLLTDVKMPRMGGLELAQRFVRLYPRAGVVFVSGYYCDESAVASGLDAERDAFVSKPFTPRQVLAAVQRVLARQSRIEVGRSGGNV
jgi:two-component system, cell cycle sensor histidine kinase and response regulator CckA